MKLGPLVFPGPFDVMIRDVQREKQRSDTKIVRAGKSNGEDEMLKTREWKPGQTSLLDSPSPLGGGCLRDLVVSAQVPAIQVTLHVCKATGRGSKMQN